MTRPYVEILGVFFHWCGPVHPDRRDPHNAADDAWTESIDEQEAMYLLDWCEEPDRKVLLFPYEPPCCGLMSYWPDPDLELMCEEATLRAALACRRLASDALRQQMERMLAVASTRAAVVAGLRTIKSPLSVEALLASFLVTPDGETASALEACLTHVSDATRLAVLDAVGPLVADHETRLSVCRILSAVTLPATVALLAPLAADPELGVRKAVAWLMSRVDSAEAKATLSTMLSKEGDGPLLRRMIERRHASRAPVDS
jgi:hypothetical protein